MLRRPFALLAGGLLALALAGCGSHTVVKTVSKTVTVQPGLKAELDQRALVSNQHLFGTIVSLAPTSEHRYLLRLQPAFLLTGVSANAAAAQAQGRRCQPTACPPVDDDSFTIPTQETLSFLVPQGALVQVLISRGAEGVEEQPITVHELAALIHGGRPVKLFEPLASGVWVVLKGDTVRAISQQYRP